MWLFPVPSTEIVPGLPPNCNPIGTLIVNKGVVLVLTPLNSVPSANLILLAVVPINEPPIFKLASLPNMIPLGLSKNKFAVPLAWIKPSMLETLPPVTRLKIFWISGALSKSAEPLLGIENWLKLWNRLFPTRFPLIMVKSLPLWETSVLRVLSGMTWALTLLQVEHIKIPPIKPKQPEVTFITPTPLKL